MIDFTNLPRRRKAYTGANGSKICVVYEGEPYMLKFPAPPSRNKAMSYANGCISEYIGCHIFESIGIPVQETLLGTYTINGKEKVVVACKDFTAPGIVLQDFASLKNTIIGSEYNGYGTELPEILETLEEQTVMEPSVLKDWFWDIFIADTLIGNWDRHNGNWGFLYHTDTDEITLAPVYDCGSCLFPQADETIMRKTIEDPAERDLRVFTIPLSGIKVNGQKIRYFDFVSSLEYDGCNRALKRILPRIDLERINSIVDHTPFISDLQKTFYKVILKERKERILDFSFQKLCQQEQKKM